MVEGLRAVFMGTPAFAVPSLEAMVAAGCHVTAVYTQPDRPKGRGGKVAASPVKEAALRLGLPVHQPERIRRPEAVAELAAMRADVMVVVGYGQIIPQVIIDMPRLGIVNVHGSLLPKYRGAAPLQWAVANGEKITGVTTMQIDAGLDTGAMLGKRETEIGPEETAVELGERLAVTGAELLVETLDGLVRGVITPEPQDDAAATLAPILRKEDGILDWTAPAHVLACRVRGFQPWPGAHTIFRGQRFQIWKAHVWEDRTELAPGELFVDGKHLLVACGDGSVLELVEVQTEGRKRMPVPAMLHGLRLEQGERLGASTE